MCSKKTQVVTVLHMYNDFFFSFFGYRLDRMSKQTTMVHQVFGGYYRSQGIHMLDVSISNPFSVNTLFS